ncbi:MAG: T9SS type A sorting domain-containing protein [Armatimonadetes bacterium]|nr:T9SS type A sorting domain-containing protein [Armatimonadota bacterium]
MRFLLLFPFSFRLFAFCFLLFFFCLFTFNLSSIEVEGHLTEDTTWSPDNNPYHVIDDVYVDYDVTLTILPGTIVKFNAARLANYQDMDNFVYYNGANIAKMLQVDGKLIADGTEEEPITFTRIQDSLYYHWGIIYLTEFADLCSFKYCHFEYSAYLLIVLGIIPNAAISIYNEEAIIEHCDFVDNFTGVNAQFFTERIIIKDNDFYNIDNISPSYPGYHVKGGVSISPSVTTESCMVLLAGNSFMETDVSWGHVDIRSNTHAYILDNFFLGESGIHADMESDFGSYIYNNEFINCDYSGGIFGGEEDNSIYIKKNNFIGGNDGIDIDDAYVEITDNYFEGCDLYSGIHNTGKAYNNISNNGNFRLPGYLEVSNNISFNGNYVGVEVSWRNISCQNNLTINNDYAIGSGGTVTYNNCVFIENEEINYFPISGNPVFRNCIIDFELEYPLIDGGGNIIVDSLQAQTLFEDIQNGDFHLIEGSLAIDAGFDTLGYYYPFDMDYNHRVWDGDNNGTAIIDIGPYEYNSPSFGGIEGFTYNPTTGEPVDYVLLKINNQPGEFTFSDSLGNFQYKLPAGIYDVYAERVFYEEVIEYEVEVFDGQFTQVLIPMLETVDVENIQYSIFNFQLRNFPNPFNQETTISFNSSRKDAKDAKIEIFNVKGQKVKTFGAFPNGSLGTRCVVWNGTDENHKPVSSGIYLYKLKVNDKTLVARKCILLK